MVSEISGARKIILVVGALALVFGSYLTIRIISLANALNESATIVQGLQNSAKFEDLEVFEAGIVKLAKAATTANSIAHDPVLAPAEWLPIIGKDFAMVKAIVGPAQELSATAQPMLKYLGELRKQAAAEAGFDSKAAHALRDAFNQFSDAANRADVVMQGIDATELHFGRAAAKLHIVQPALSKQIAALERELGVLLFERNKRRVELTDAGRVFAEQVTDILARVERASQLAVLASKGHFGQLSIGFIGPAMESVLPAILLEFRTRFPEVHLTLEEATTADQVRMLRDNSLDVGMVRMPLDDAGLDLREILSEPIIAALPRTHRLARRRELELRHLAEESFVAIPRRREPGLYDLCVSACRQAGFSPRFAEEALSLHGLLGLVAGGLGVALVPRSVQNLQRTGVVYKALRDTKFQLRLAIATRHGESGGTVMRLLDLVQQMAPTLERSETTTPA